MYRLTMRLSLAILFSAVSSVFARSRPIPIVKNDIAADSALGMKVLSNARRLEEDGDEADMTWVAGYSIKFQGCHHIQQWNDDADEENDVRIMTKRLVRFRLCPTETCSTSQAEGCSNGYGSYIVDLNTFMDAYFEVTRRASEYECEYYLNNNCDCGNDDGGGNEEYCEYDCYADAGLAETCADRNPYNDDEEEEEFRAEEYMECKEFDIQNDDDGNADNEYFVGPYCAEQGGAVYLGFFTDDSCSTFAGDNGGVEEFEALTGEDLPYSSVSIVSASCVACIDMEQNDNDDQDENELVMDACEDIYLAAGKCEDNLPSGMVDEPNENACNYIEGVRVIRQDGIVRIASPQSNGTATFFIVLFALLTAGLAFYVHYLRTRLSAKQNTLL